MRLRTGRHVQSIGLVMLAASSIVPVSVQAQSNDNAVMRMVCFAAPPSAGVVSNGGWTVVITQMTNENYAADIFIPDENGEYADKFPMFDNTLFYASVFENAPKAGASDTIESYAAELLRSVNAPAATLSEGNRVGTLLDLKLDGSGAFQYDSVNQNNNLFVDPTTGEERHPICGSPFFHVQ